MLIVLVERKRLEPARCVVRGDEARPAIRVGDQTLPVTFAGAGATILASDGPHHVTAGTAKVFWAAGARVSAWIE